MSAVETHTADQEDRDDREDRRWPRMMRLAKAAKYCDLSPECFRREIRVAPQRFGGAVRWDRHEIDIYLDSRRRVDSGQSKQIWLDKFGAD
jgi:hypothetical protein